MNGSEHMFYNAKEGKIIVQGKSFDYISFGKGNKTLIMIQGLNTRGVKGASIPLAYMYRAFAKEYKVYLFERRPDIKTDITIRDMAADVAACMDRLGIKSADVLGVSQGGMIAQYLAIDRPDLVNKLVLAVTTARTNPKVEDAIEKWVGYTRNGDIKSLVYDMALRMYSEKYLKKYRILLPLLVIAQKPKDAERFIYLAKACLTCSAYDELDKIKCPVYVIGSSCDKVVGGESSSELADKLKCGKYIYNDVGHALYEQAGDFSKKVLDFLTK